MVRRILVLITAALILTGCGSGGDDPTAARRSVTVVLDWTPNTNHSGVYLARHNGLYDRAGLDVSIVEPDQAGGVAQLAAGNATFAFSYAEQVLPARDADDRARTTTTAAAAAHSRCRPLT